MSERNAYVAGLPVSVLVPWLVLFGLAAGWTGNSIGTPTNIVAKSQTREDVGNQTQTPPAFAAIPPASRAIAIHLA